MPRRRGLAAAGAWAVTLALWTAALAGDASTPVAVGARLAQDANGARLVFDVSLPVEARAYALPSPDRIIVDLPEVNFQLNSSVVRESVANDATIVKAFRFGLLAPGKSRIVIDLVRPACPTEVVSKPVVDGASASRLWIELRPCEAAAFAALGVAGRPSRRTLIQCRLRPFRSLFSIRDMAARTEAPADSAVPWKKRSCLNFARSSSSSSKQLVDIPLH